MVKQNSASAQEANALSQKSQQSAQNGEIEINKLLSAMSEISTGSKKIEEIIKVIDDIAFQTNLLALNAAVEAARAGEQGKGFAVVAEAVRSLAQRSAVAAKDISSLIEENVSKSQNGSFIAESSASALRDILTSIRKVADLNSEISAGSNEQANGLDQISRAMNQLDQATQGNASSAEEIDAFSNQLASHSENLNNLTQKLKVVLNGE